MKIILANKMSQEEIELENASSLLAKYCTKLILNSYQQPVMF